MIEKSAFAPRIVRNAGAFAASALLTAAASAQPLSVRWEATALPFSPLHSYTAGHLGDSVLFFTGISGQGLHNLVQGNGTIVAFPLSVFSDQVHMVDTGSSTLYSGSIAHFSEAMRNRLRITNAAEIQLGDTLYIYGGYGPIEGVSEWYTYASVVAVDLVAVDAALRANSPIPESAFTVLPSTAAQVAGASMIRMGGMFALIGGSNFEGDYGLGFNNPQPFTNTYSDRVHIFDSSVSMTVPQETFVDPYWLHRRDMMAAPITLSNGEGGTRYGFTVPGGVFNAVFPWENPLTYGVGDTEVATDVNFIQRMNQYEAGRVSLFSESAGANRIVLMGGITFQVYDEVFKEWYYDFTIPWSDTITELTCINGAYVADSEISIGETPLPVSNARFILAANMPTNVNEQIMLDDMPHNEHLIGRIYGGLAADSPSPEPPTWAASVVYNVYMAVGVRGDVNKDGVVNFSDLNILLGQYNQVGSLLPADLNLDGTVNFADLNVVLSNFNSTTPG